MLSHRAGDGGNKARLTREITKETVKTIARGMPGVSGVTVVTTLVCSFLFCMRGCGRARRARHSLRPLLSEGVHAQLGRFPRGGIAKLRSCAAGCLKSRPMCTQTHTSFPEMPRCDCVGKMSH